MGRSYTPKYRVETVEWVAERGVSKNSFAWAGKAPTSLKLKDWRAAMNKSFEAGGVNAHLKFTVIGSCKVIEQATGRVVVEYTPPAFEIV